MSQQIVSGKNNGVKTGKKTKGLSEVLKGHTPRYNNSVSDFFFFFFFFFFLIKRANGKCNVRNFDGFSLFLHHDSAIPH